MLIRALTLEKNNWTKINQGTFRIDKIVWLIVINRKLTMTLMRLTAIKYFDRLTALLQTCSRFKGCICHMQTSIRTQWNKTLSGNQTKCVSTEKTIQGWTKPPRPRGSNQTQIKKSHPTLETEPVKLRVFIWTPFPGLTSPWTRHTIIFEVVPWPHEISQGLRDPGTLNRGRHYWSEYYCTTTTRPNPITSTFCYRDPFTFRARFFQNFLLFSLNTLRCIAHGALGIWWAEVIPVYYHTLHYRTAPPVLHMSQ